MWNPFVTLWESRQSPTEDTEQYTVRFMALRSEASLDSEMVISNGMDIPKPQGYNAYDDGDAMGASPVGSLADAGWSNLNLGSLPTSPSFPRTMPPHSPSDSHLPEVPEEPVGTPDPQFDLLPGELVSQKATFINNHVYMTNYRLCIVSHDGRGCAVIPHANLDAVDGKDLQLMITCKDGRVFRLTAPSNELPCEWYKELYRHTTRTDVRDCFAFQFCTANKTSNEREKWLEYEYHNEEVEATGDFKRLDFPSDYFYVSNANRDFKVCETYPTTLIVPNDLKDADLMKCRDFRFLGRLPSVVWRCKGKNTYLLRSSQPRTSLFSWRSGPDEKILECVRKAMDKEKGDDAFITIMDARSYTAAWANRAKGGGFESTEYYKNTDVLFLGLPNIHNVRYSFHQLRTLLNAPADQNNYLQQLQTTNWFLYLSSLLGAAENCVDLLMDHGRSVLVHCSDGWDRTTQIVSFAKILADEHYRTIEGFESLIRREWVSFGHKFADRNGISGTDVNERAPVFLQFLDGVHQFITQNPTAFEFNMNYLVKLAEHTYSGLFGTFLHNSLKDAKEACSEQASASDNRPCMCTVSVWRFLHKKGDEVVNQLYNKEKNLGRLNIKVGVEHTRLWREVYCCSDTEQAICAKEERQTLTVIVANEHRESRGNEMMEKSVFRSSSSDSVNRVAEGQVMVSNPAHGSSNNVGDWPDSLDCVPHCMTESTISKRTDSIVSKNRSMEASVISVTELLDADGLVKFRDPTQEEMLRVKREREAKDRALEERKRLESERDSDTLLRNGHPRSATDLLDTVNDSDDASVYSDSSILQMTEADVGPNPSNGWALGEKQCACCGAHYTTLNREHHCRNCLKSVCDTCSQHRYHTSEGAKSVLARACSICYRKMEPRRRAESDATDCTTSSGGSLISQPQSVPTDYGNLFDTKSLSGSLTSQCSISGTQTVMG